MKTIFDNYRVEVSVTPPQWQHPPENDVGGKWHSDRIRDAEAVAKEIRRHVDGYDFINVQFDATHVCEHCGYRWDDPKSQFNDCCEKSMNPEEA